LKDLRINRIIWEEFERFGKNLIDLGRVSKVGGKIRKFGKNLIFDES
jgi:hypothetical protein